MSRSILFAVAAVLSGSAIAQTAADFEQANTHAEAQRLAERVATSAYADAWAQFNNRHRLDERDGCYFRADGELVQVLEIDGSGKVVGYFADREDGRSRCWRATYLGVVFPAPPFAPYWHKLVMH